MTENEKWIMEHQEELSGEYIMEEVHPDHLADMMDYFPKFVNEHMRGRTGENKEYEVWYHVELIIEDVKEL